MTPDSDARFPEHRVDSGYQTIHALAGTLAEAKLQQANLALHLVHEFKTSRWSEKAAAINAESPRLLVSNLPGYDMISPTDTEPAPSWCVGGIGDEGHSRRG